MIGDIPHIASSTYGTNTSTLNLASFTGVAQSGTGVGQLAYNRFVDTPSELTMTRRPPGQPFHNDFPPQQESIMAAHARRLVQVFIADPDENVPLDKSLLYTGSQKLTDATDQELYFEIDIKNILETHNKMRIELVNKKVKERIEHLEPARVRDLRMVVVNVATF